jgi:hypothetical protein
VIKIYRKTSKVIFVERCPQLQQTNIKNLVCKPITQTTAGRTYNSYVTSKASVRTAALATTGYQ